MKASSRQPHYGLSRDALIIHCPGPLRSPGNPLHRDWDRACASFFADDSLRGAYASHADLTIITYNSYLLPCLLERCLAHLGVDGLVVLGRGKTDWTWEYKVSLVRDYLASDACRSEYVLCLDGYDVLVLSGPSVILRRFMRSGCQMLFCSTAWDWPPSPECRRFEESVTAPADRAHQHLNAGGILARRSFLEPRLAEIMDAAGKQRPWCFARHGFSDQLAWRHLHRRYYPAIRVDTSCDLFVRFDADR